MRVLLVEVDPHTLLYLQEGLDQSGVVLDVAQSGDAALTFAHTCKYDLIVLDVMLPGRDGWSVLRELRLSGKQVPVIFLTSRDTVDDRVRGLEMGADDYLIKPFAFTELLARIRTVLRRATAQPLDMVRIGDLEIDLIRHKASRAGQRLDLRPKEFALLSLLARRRGEVLTRTFISEQVWDMDFDNDSNVIDVHVRRLRRAVDDPWEQKLIHTVVGVGYVLEDRP